MADFALWEREILNRFAHSAAKKLLERKERIEALEAAMRRMVDAVDLNHCSGESQFAMGVNAACENHVVGLVGIMEAVGVKPETEGVKT